METIPNWIAIVSLGLIKGITEFIPISSICHLLIPRNLGWLPHQSDPFPIVIQSGAVLANRVKQFAFTVDDPGTRDYPGKPLAACCVVRWLIRFVQSHSCNGFAWYRLVMAGALIACMAMEGEK